MKATVLAVALFFSTFISAQINYLANSPSWRINSACSAPYPCIRNDYARIDLNGDTLFADGYNWTRITRTGISIYTDLSMPPLPGGCIGSFPIDEKAGYIRQSGKKLFFRTMGSAEELLYDFDLNLGDTLPISRVNFMTDLVVDSLDSVYVGDAWRRRMFFNGQSSYLVEGIGHNLGFLESIPPMLECGHTLICYSLNGVLAFQPNPFACELPNAISEIDGALSALSISKTGNDWMILGASQAASFKLYSLQGKEIEVAIHREDEHWKFDSSSLPAGMYLLLESTSGKVLRFLNED
jgi:hypothetical protein